MNIPTKAPRWYAWKDGVITPLYEAPRKLPKDGKSTKGYTLTEARKDLERGEFIPLPSVTSVLSVIDKPELDNWRVEQAIMAAITLPRLEMTCNVEPGYHEPDDVFAKRVLTDAEFQANKAAEFGTRIHDEIAGLMGIMKENGNNMLHVTKDFEIAEYLRGFRQWATENIEEVHAVEKVVGHPSIGVAGRMDLDCTLKGVGRCVCDFKTQAVRNGKAAFWPDWGPQLAAYAMCCVGAVRGEIARHLVSVVIPSNEPGPVSIKAYDAEEHFRSRRIFGNALELWILTRGNGYDPRQQ